MLAAAAALFILAGCGQKQQPAPPPPAVTVATPLQQNIVDWDEYVGRFEAIKDVQVKPRVSGYLTSANFRDGDYVRAGQLLFTIDARPARALVDQARANLARAQAVVVNARTELARSRTLAAQRAASTEEVEQRLAALRAGEADVAAARATLRSQGLNLGFTRVTAPISGRVSQRRVDPGNAVSADQTVLTTIVSSDPIHFAFDSSEALLLRYQRQAGSSLGREVRIRLADESDYIHRGRLDFLDNSINPQAGTIQARAIVPNGDGFIRPGMTAHVRLAGSASYTALLVPDTAIATDGVRRLLHVADMKGNVKDRPVELGPLIGGLRVIRRGIGPNDLVVIDGLQRILPGQKVSPKRGRIAPQAAGETPEVPVQAPPASSATAAGI